MPVFVGVHKMAPLTDEKVQEIWGKYKQAAISLGLKPLRLHYNAGEGAAFCETEAPSANEVVSAHQGLNIPQEIIEVKTLE